MNEEEINNFIRDYITEAFYKRVCDLPVVFALSKENLRVFNKIKICIKGLNIFNELSTEQAGRLINSQEFKELINSMQETFSKLKFTVLKDFNCNSIDITAVSNKIDTILGRAAAAVASTDSTEFEERTVSKFISEIKRIYPKIVDDNRISDEDLKKVYMKYIHIYLKNPSYKMTLNEIRRIYNEYITSEDAKAEERLKLEFENLPRRYHELGTLQDESGRLRAEVSDKTNEQVREDLCTIFNRGLELGHPFFTTRHADYVEYCEGAAGEAVAGEGAATLTNSISSLARPLETPISLLTKFLERTPSSTLSEGRDIINIFERDGATDLLLIDRSTIVALQVHLNERLQSRLRLAYPQNIGNIQIVLDINPQDIYIKIVNIDKTFRFDGVRTKPLNLIHCTLHYSRDPRESEASTRAGTEPLGKQHIKLTQISEANTSYNVATGEISYLVESTISVNFSLNISPLGLIDIQREGLTSGLTRSLIRGRSNRTLFTNIDTKVTLICEISEIVVNYIASMMLPRVSTEEPEGKLGKSGKGGGNTKRKIIIQLIDIPVDYNLSLNIELLKLYILFNMCTELLLNLNKDELELNDIIINYNHLMFEKEFIELSLIYKNVVNTDSLDYLQKLSNIFNSFNESENINFGYYEMVSHSIPNNLFNLEETTNKLLFYTVPDDLESLNYDINSFIYKQILEPKNTSSLLADSYYSKYLKYKQKYLELKKLIR